MANEHLPIEEMEVFLRYEEVADWVWSIVRQWSRFEQDTIGSQLVRAADSVGANLVEGDGRYGIPDSIHFFVIARASARETRLWLKRAIKRNLAAPDAEAMMEKLTGATQLLNKLINYRRKVAKSGPPTTSHPNTRTPEHLNT